MEEMQRPNKIEINAKTSNVIEFHLKHDEQRENLPFEQLIPEVFHNYLNVFDESKAKRFPGPCLWDHKIELKEGFEILQNVQSNPRRAKGIGPMVERKPGERIHPTIAITNGLPIFLCKEERQKTQALSGLPISQWLDHQTCILTTSYLGTNG